MPNHAMLNNVAHKDMHIITDHGASYGDNVMSAFTFPAEFRDVQAHYPIVFRKIGDGGFESLALFGFQEGENLFLGPQGWDASYVPLAIQRQPFLIGANGEELMVHVDLDSPRVSRTQGEPVFKPHGGTTEYLENVNSTLLALHNGIQQQQAFIAALLRHELLESFVFDIELNNGSQNRLIGFYTINEERLSKLGAAALEELHSVGYLGAMYMQIASLSNFRALIERKNRAA